MYNQIPSRYRPNPNRKNQNCVCYTSWIIVGTLWASVLGAVL